MGNVFSLSSGCRRGCIGRHENIAREQISSHIENMKDDVHTGKDENTNKIQIEKSPDGCDLQLDGNQEDKVVLNVESKAPIAIQRTYNVQIQNCSNVVTGDNNKIIVQQSKQVAQKLRIQKAPDEVATVVPGYMKLMDEEAQVSSQTFDKNITICDPNIAIGDGNIIYVQQDDHFCQDEASSPSQSAHRRLFPLKSELQELPSPGVEPQIKKVLGSMCVIVHQLYPLRDGGKWQAFEKALNRLHSSYNVHPAITCFLLLEESVKLTYQKRFKEAKRKAKESLKIVNNEGNQISGALQDVLRVLGNVALASVFRRLPKRKLGMAFNCLEDARESSERLKRINLTMPKFALALLDYEQARCHMEFGTLRCESKSCNKEVGKFLGLCIDRCRSLSDETHLYRVKQTFAMIYMAQLSLPSGHSEPGQCKRVKRQCAKQAEKHLEEFQRSHSHLGDYPVAARVKYLLTRSELCFLKRDYALAKDFGCQALEIALKYGFQLETAPAQNHVEQISRYCSRQHKLQRVKNRSSGHSSSTTTDSDQKYVITCSQRAT